MSEKSTKETVSERGKAIGPKRRERARTGKEDVSTCGSVQVESAPLSLATGSARRARGLLLSRPGDEALLLMPCNDVHTVGMRQRIDVAFVDLSGCVLEAHREVGPFRRLRNRRAAAVVERFSSCASPWFSAGDKVGVVRMEGASS